METERQTAKLVDQLRGMVLGTFCLKLKQMEIHPMQRPLNLEHVAVLRASFIEKGIDRVSDFFAGIIPNLNSRDQLPGECEDLPEHLKALIVHGQHRFKALGENCEETGNAHEAYWYVRIYKDELNNQPELLAFFMDHCNMRVNPLPVSTAHKYIRYISCSPEEAQQVLLIETFISNKPLTHAFHILRSQPVLRNAVSNLIQEFPAFANEVSASFFIQLVKYRLFTAQLIFVLDALTWWRRLAEFKHGDPELPPAHSPAFFSLFKISDYQFMYPTSGFLKSKSPREGAEPVKFDVGPMKEHMRSRGALLDPEHEELYPQNLIDGWLFEDVLQTPRYFSTKNSPLVELSLKLYEVGRMIVLLLCGQTYYDKCDMKAKDSEVTYVSNGSTFLHLDRYTDGILKTVYFAEQCEAGLFPTDDLFPSPDQVLERCREQGLMEAIEESTGNFLTQLYGFLIHGNRVSNLLAECIARSKQYPDRPLKDVLKELVQVDNEWFKALCVFGVPLGNKFVSGERFCMPKETPLHFNQSLKIVLDNYIAQTEEHAYIIKQRHELTDIESDLAKTQLAASTLQVKLRKANAKVEDLTKRKAEQEKIVEPKYRVITAAGPLYTDSQLSKSQMRAKQVDSYIQVRENEQPPVPHKPLEKEKVEKYVKEFADRLIVETELDLTESSMDSFLHAVRGLPEFNTLFGTLEEQVIRWFRLLESPVWLKLVSTGELFRRIENGEAVDALIDDIYGSQRGPARDSQDSAGPRERSVAPDGTLPPSEIPPPNGLIPPSPPSSARDSRPRIPGAKKHKSASVVPSDSDPDEEDARGNPNQDGRDDDVHSNADQDEDAHSDADQDEDHDSDREENPNHFSGVHDPPEDKIGSSSDSGSGEEGFQPRPTEIVRNPRRGGQFGGKTIPGAASPFAGKTIPGPSGHVGGKTIPGFQSYLLSHQKRPANGQPSTTNKKRRRNKSPKRPVLVPNTSPVEPSSSDSDKDLTDEISQFHD